MENKVEDNQIENKVEDNQIIVVIIKNDEYQKRVMQLAKELSDFVGKICYISLNKPYGTLTKNLTNAGIDLNKFIFVDAITRTAEIPSDVENCEFVSSPGALTELSLTVSNILASKEVDLVLFDSLSTLLVYEKVDVVTKFVHSLMAKVRVINCRAIFTCLKQDADSVLLKDVNMFADKIIDMERWPAFR